MKNKNSKKVTGIVHGFFALVVFTGVSDAQIDDICAEAGITPSFDSPFAQVPYAFGRIVVRNAPADSRLPSVTVSLISNQNSTERLVLGKSGNYCFRRRSAGGTLVIEVNGVETARRSLATFGAAQQREDFEIFATALPTIPPPAVVSAKFSHPTNEKTAELYKKAAEAEKNKNLERTVEFLTGIVTIDPADFIAWAKLGTMHAEQKSYAAAETAFRKSLELKPEYTPAWINAGKIRMAQKQYEAAIEVFKHAVSLDPKSARPHQLLGEAYILAKQGSLGAESLNQALRLDPVGSAELHLMLARLYDLAGAKNLASREYKMFLARVPEHPDRKKFEKYMKENPE